jgi:diguanylate cyclase (GGDEF) domain
LFLVYLALFYRFPSTISQKKMRSDINVDEVVLEPIRNYERDLIEKDRLFQMMIDVSSEGFWTFDVSSNKVFWSNKVGKILGIDALGDSFEVVKGCVLESDWESFRKSLQECLNEKRNFTIRMRLLNKMANCEAIVISGRPQCNEAGLLIRVIGSLSAIQDSRNLVRENDFLSTCDSLTGVSNRQEFLNELAKEVEKSTERPDYIFAVALLDIDSFAAINDSYSIDVGDQVLRIVADRITASSRTGDSVARIGPGCVCPDIPEYPGERCQCGTYFHCAQSPCQGQDASPVGWQGTVYQRFDVCCGKQGRRLRRRLAGERECGLARYEEGRQPWWRAVLYGWNP